MSRTHQCYVADCSCDGNHSGTVEVKSVSAWAKPANATNYIEPAIDGTRLDMHPAVAAIVGDVYKRPAANLVAPEGYIFTGEFRCPVKADDWLPVDASIAFAAARGEFYASPRLILRKKPKLIGYKFVIEKAGVKQAERGEWYSGSSGSIHQAAHTFAPWREETLTIYRREEIYE